MGANKGKAQQTYGTAEVARLISVSPQRVRRMARLGYCRPARDGRKWKFTFQDLVLLRTATGLLRANVSARRVRSALRSLSKQLPEDRPLSAFRIYADGRSVTVREGRRAWNPDTGQAVFVFESGMAAATTKAMSLQPPRGYLQRVDPEPPDGSAAAGWFNYALSLEGLDSAESARAYRRAIELDPRFGDAYINLGRIEHAAGNGEEAERLYRRALEFIPQDPVARYNLALALEDRGDQDGAVKLYREAVEIAPDFADAHFNLGRLLDRLGHKSEALKHFLAYRRLSKG